MSEVLKLADRYRLDVEMRAFAHYASAEYHRKKGVLFGSVAAGLGGAAGLSTLASATSRLDSIKDVLPQFAVSWFAVLVAFAIVFLLSSVVSAVVAFLQHPKQATTHMVSYAGYSHLTRRLETFGLRYADPSSANSDPAAALNMLDGISKEIEAVAAASIYPVQKAYEEGKRIKNWERKFGGAW